MARTAQVLSVDLEKQMKDESQSDARTKCLNRAINTIKTAKNIKTDRTQTCQVKCPGAEAQSAYEIVLCGALLGINCVRDFRRKLKMGKEQGIVSKEREGGGDGGVRGGKKNVAYWIC
jgi:hypothetical protein